MPITTLPVPPTRNDPANFAERADSFLSALPTFAIEANVLQADVNAKQTAAAANQVAAQAAQTAAEAASNATVWVSGTTYAVGNVRYSPIDFKSYRRKTAGAGTTDPSSDSTNWQLLTGLGNVDLSAAQTLTNKTINGTNNTITNVSLTTGVAGTLPVANGGTGGTTAAAARSSLGADNASNLTSGTVAAARLGSGTANNSAYLAGDNTWQPVNGKVLLGSWSYTTNVATINFLNLAGWDEIDIMVEGVTSSVSTNWVRVSFDNGTAFQTTGYDGRVGDGTDSNSVSTALEFTRGGSGTIIGKVTLSSMLTRGILTGVCSIGARVPSTATRAPAGTVNAIQIGSAGVFSTGSIKIYGVKR